MSSCFVFMFWHFKNISLISKVVFYFVKVLKHWSRSIVPSIVWECVYKLTLCQILYQNQRKIFSVSYGINAICRGQLKNASGCGKFLLHWRPVGDLLLFCVSMVGLLSLLLIPYFHFQFYKNSHIKKWFVEGYYICHINHIQKMFSWLLLKTMISTSIFFCWHLKLRNTNLKKKHF